MSDGRGEHKTKKGVADSFFRSIVGAKGFEPSTPCSQSRCASRTAPYPEKKDDLHRLLSFAEKGGFEPPVPLAGYDSLANCWFQPLTHLSSAVNCGCKNRHFPNNYNHFLQFFSLKSSFLLIFNVIDFYSKKLMKNKKIQKTACYSNNSYICRLIL